MPTTPNHGLTYPASTDHTRIWEHVQTLAEDTERELDELSGASGAAIDPTSRTTTSTSFTSTLSPAGILGVVFTAPASGKVLLLYAGDQDCSGGAGSFSESAPAVRTGGVLASGSVVLAAAHDRALIAYDGAQMRMGAHTRLTGLTPGSTYNVVMEHATSTGTGTFRFREITVVPLAA